MLFTSYLNKKNFVCNFNVKEEKFSNCFRRKNCNIENFSLEIKNNTKFHQIFIKISNAMHDTYFRQYSLRTRKTWRAHEEAASEVVKAISCILSGSKMNISRGEFVQTKIVANTR
jgi:hypothetical protein